MWTEEGMVWELGRTEQCTEWERGRTEQGMARELGRSERQQQRVSDMEPRTVQPRRRSMNPSAGPAADAFGHGTVLVRE